VTKYPFPSIGDMKFHELFDLSNLPPFLLVDDFLFELELVEGQRAVRLKNIYCRKGHKFFEAPDLLRALQAVQEEHHEVVYADDVRKAVKQREQVRSLRLGKYSADLDEVAKYVEELGDGATKLPEAISARFNVSRPTACRYLRLLRAKRKK
jgi:hypothetical protein